MEDTEREYDLESREGEESNSVASLQTILRRFDGEASGDGRDGGERKRKERESGGENGGGSKKRGEGGDEENYPWSDASREYARDALSDSMRKTRQFIEIARRDISTALFSIQRTADAPPNFPISEWSNILHGRAIDLGTVYANMHMLQPVREAIGSVGGVPIRFPQVERGKGIKTASEWTAAWQRAVQATTIAFPHRRRELDAYGQYIISLFSSTQVSIHHRIILFDEAVRGLVGGGESYALTDQGAYQHLYTAYLMPGGVEASKTAKKGANRQEICRRFNILQTGCPTGANCRYRHACLTCGGAHARIKCNQSQPGLSSQS